MSIRVPPHNIEAEQAILGGLMVDEYAWEQVLAVLSEGDFYRPAHRKIYAGLLELNSRGMPTDLITASHHLSEKKELDGIGGASYLAELMNQTPTAANIGIYAKIVHEKALMRRLIHVSGEIIEKSYGESYETVEKFLDEVESQVFSIGHRNEGGLVSVAELIKGSMQKLTELATQTQDITGLPSGFKDLDRFTSGFQPGEMIIIAARPSMGKTAFSLNIAQHLAIHMKKSVAYFSVEMGQEQLLLRMLASESRVNLTELRNGKVNDSAWPRLIDKATKLGDAPLWIDDSSGISPLEIRAKARRLKSKGKLDMIMVDYLQLMQLKQKVDSREREVSEISRTLKAIAKELKIPVIALAQLNRSSEKRTDGRPVLSDLRESGSIEQDADVIMMLYRQEYYEPDNPEVKGLAEVIVNKNRNGPVGTAKLKWEAGINRFADREDGVGNHPLPPPPNAGQNQFRPRPKNLAPSAEG